MEVNKTPGSVWRYHREIFRVGSCVVAGSAIHWPSHYLDEKCDSDGHSDKGQPGVVPAEQKRPNQREKPAVTVRSAERKPSLLPLQLLQDS